MTREEIEAEFRKIQAKIDSGELSDISEIVQAGVRLGQEYSALKAREGSAPPASLTKPQEGEKTSMAPDEFTYEKSEEDEEEKVVEKKAKKVHVGKVERHGQAMVIPDGMSLTAAKEIIERQMKYEEEVVVITETIDYFPWDGAYALIKVMERKFGWASAEPIPGWFGEQPPRVISIEVAPGVHQNIVWGQFSLPNIQGRIGCDMINDRGILKFQIQAKVKRKSEPIIKELAEEVRQYLKTGSIYRGKTISIQFSDEDGERMAMAEVKFIDLSKVHEENLIFSDDVFAMVSDYVFAHIDKRRFVKQFKMNSKRGVLLHGLPGTGKTLTAMVAAKKANAQGITVVYNKEIQDFADAMKFAVQYGPSLLFQEDIDRVTGGARDQAMDRILNILDGIETKNSDVMVILTSNNADVISKPMLRPGRIDVCIPVEPPDAKAVERLVRLYGAGMVTDDDLSEVGALLNGQIPAVIAEVVDRAKLSAIARLGADENPSTLAISSKDLVTASKSMKHQLDMLNKPPMITPTDMQQLGTAVGAEIAQGFRVAALVLSDSHRGQDYIEARRATPELKAGDQPNQA